jgi:hypothetical protein
MKKIKHPPKIHIIGFGKRKFKYIKDIISSDALSYANTFIFASPEDNKLYYNTYNTLPSHLHCYDGFQDDVIQKLWEKQRRKVRKHGRDHKNRIMIIVDLCDNMEKSNEFIKSKVVQDLFFNARSFNTSFILVSQCPIRIPPSYRASIDYIFFLEKNEITTQTCPLLSFVHLMYQHYGGMVDKDTFNQICKKVAIENKCLVINQRNQQIEDIIFWY